MVVPVLGLKIGLSPVVDPVDVADLSKSGDDSRPEYSAIITPALKLAARLTAKVVLAEDKLVVYHISTVGTVAFAA